MALCLKIMPIFFSKMFPKLSLFSEICFQILLHTKRLSKNFMHSYLLAIDQGTTGTNVIVVASNGEIVGQFKQEFTQFYPQPGWVEHDVEEIWQVTLAAIEQVLKETNIGRHQIHSIGITNQRETTVLWERQGMLPISKAIVWQCRRTAPMCQALKEQGRESWIKSKTGLVIDAYFSGTKIAWLLDNIPTARTRAHLNQLAFGTIDTWLLSKFTSGKVHATDYTNASRTMIFNIHERRWDQELLSCLNIPENILPEVKPSSYIFGTTDPYFFDGNRVPIAGIAGDQQAALYAQGCFSPGMGKNTYGTGNFMLVYLGNKPAVSNKGLLTTLACDEQGQVAYALEGSIFITGAAVQWLRDGLKIIENASQTESIAQQVPDTGGVYLVPAFVGLGAPYWNSTARGALVGITRGTGQAEIVRATLESIAYQTRDIVEIISQESGVELKCLNVDGGASQNNFLMQFQADMLGVPIQRSRNTDSTTAMGAAFLAGLSSQFWTLEEIKKIRACEKIFEPQMPNAQKEQLYDGWKKAVARVL